VREILVDMSGTEAMAAASAALSRVGRLKRKADGGDVIRGSVGSGPFRINRAKMMIRAKPMGRASSRLILTASAREGMIFQNTAGTAIARILDASGVHSPAVFERRAGW
jgi:hypothetical protein